MFFSQKKKEHNSYSWRCPLPWWQEFKAQQVVVEGNMRQGSSEAEERQWRPPPSGLVKINFDGAVFAKENKSGARVGVRNEEGYMIASCTKKLQAAYNGGEVETISAVVALSFASEIGIKRAILEGDSL